MTKFTLKNITLRGFLLWATPLLLIVPNVCLAVTEQWHPLAKTAGVVLPLGLYCLIAACSKKVGRTVLWCIPLMIYCAFQIVLIYLYGESIIAIDMFLNVFTTNPAEVAELLGNLLIAIFTVVVLYVPLIVSAIVAVAKKRRSSPEALRPLRRAGLALSAVGIVLLAVCYAVVPGYRAERQLFPVNVIYNNVAAVNRARYIGQYHDTSSAFSYHAASSRHAGEREVYVLVVGETSRAANWQLAGYGRETNPRLSRRSDIVFFPHALSESNTTHKSVPMIMSWLDADTFGDSIYTTKGILSAFNEAGYYTAFLSNQKRNRSFIEFFGNEADTVSYITDRPGPHLDGELLGELDKVLAAHPDGKLMVVLHTYGSHFNYRERYPAGAAHFSPADRSEASVENLPQLLNAYDNTIRYTDGLLDSLATRLEALGCPSAMVYLSDHGEDIFDDPRNRFLHASPTPTCTQVHVPMLAWTSAAHRELYPELTERLRAHARAEVSSSASAFPTMIGLAGISTPYRDPVHDLTDSLYRATPRRYVTDYNEGVPLSESGLRDYDFDAFEHAGISVK